ncbi:hypothetical protein [Coleofasciculus sp.]|uniref:hypothetical protein n=1 Tax=Coleofasciculus sp. TaxID=3100458 RepID=UPI0039F80EBF
MTILARDAQTFCLEQKFNNPTLHVSSVGIAGQTANEYCAWIECSLYLLSPDREITSKAK